LVRFGKIKIFHLPKHPIFYGYGNINAISSDFMQIETVLRFLRLTNSMILAK